MKTTVVVLAELLIEVRYEGEPPLITVDTVRVVEEDGAVVGPVLFGLFFNSYLIVDEQGTTMRLMDVIMDLVLQIIDPNRVEQVVVH